MFYSLILPFFLDYHSVQCRIFFFELVKEEGFSVLVFSLLYTREQGNRVWQLEFSFFL